MRVLILILFAVTLSACTKEVEPEQLFERDGLQYEVIEGTKVFRYADFAMAISLVVEKYIAGEFIQRK